MKYPSPEEEELFLLGVVELVIVYIILRFMKLFGAKMQFSFLWMSFHFSPYFQ